MYDAERGGKQRSQKMQRIKQVEEEFIERASR